jgi:uncharacterized protein involved in exopolysaccharide biosynthesis
MLHRVLIARTGMVLGLLIAVITFLRPVTYTSRAVLATPPVGIAPAGLGGLASQLGIGMGMSGMARPAAFYVDFARSDEVMRELAQHSYRYEYGDTVCQCDLVRYLVGDGKPHPLGVELAGKELRRRISASMSKEAGTLAFAATFDDPQLAQAVTSQLLEEIDQFNVRERYERAAAERAFLQEQLDSAEIAQREAEAQLEEFLVANRDFRNSPALQVRFERLNREVGLRQELTASINSSYEKARLEEHRNTGVMVVVAEPSLPVQRVARFLVVKTLIAVLLGLVLGVTIAWGMEAARDPTLPGYPDDVARRVRAMTAIELRRPWRLLGFRRTGSSSEG